MSLKSVEKLFNPQSVAFPPLMLAVLYIIVDVFLVGFARWEFPYGIVYTLEFLSIAAVFVKPTYLTGLAGTGIGLMALFLQFGFNAFAGLVVSAVLFIIVAANAFGILGMKAQADTRFMVALPLSMLFGWVLYYFYNRLSTGMLLTPAIILNHVGLALVCLDGLGRVPFAESKKAWKFPWIGLAGLAVTVFGTLWMTVIDHGGLQLLL